MANPSGREELRRLVDMDIPEPPVQSYGKAPPTLLQTSNRPASTIERFQSDNFDSAKGKLQHQLTLPTFSKSRQEQPQTVQQPLFKEH